mmetsp:Transcript_8315/g.18631  ORF Transcript_8315/g.18631 Transcript_8315/m.18631 type:complete len:124 (-) Transcript_8315:263-634(-)
MCITKLHPEANTLIQSWGCCVKGQTQSLAASMTGFVECFLSLKTIEGNARTDDLLPDDEHDRHVVGDEEDSRTDGVRVDASCKRNYRWNIVSEVGSCPPRKSRMCSGLILAWSSRHDACTTPI